MTKEIPLNHGYIATVDDEDYDTLSCFLWQADCNKNKVYALSSRKINGKWTRVKMHRLVIGAPLGTQVDHINGDGLDNRRSNLRLATHSQQAQNSQKHWIGSSQYKGVSFHRGKWRANICIEGTDTSVGKFATEIEAARAYDKAAIEAFGEYARPNFTREQS